MEAQIDMLTHRNVPICLFTDLPMQKKATMKHPKKIQNAQWGSSGKGFMAVRFFQHNRRLGSKSRFCLSECFQGLIWQMVVVGQTFLAKATLGIHKQVLAIRTILRGLCGKECLAVRFFQQNRCLGSKSRFCLSECILGLIWHKAFGGQPFLAESTHGFEKQVLAISLGCKSIICLNAQRVLGW